MSEGLSIQDVSRQCGINPVTLRAWERRYGLVRPSRTPRGHRRYTEQDVARIREILHWVDRGVPLRQVKAWLEGNRMESAEEGEHFWSQARDEAFQALDTLNTRRLEQLLNRLLADYSHARVIRSFTDPLRERLAASHVFSAHRALLDAFLTEKWGARSLSLVPRRGQFGWLLVPVGDMLSALELAMVLNQPVWCLHRAPDFAALPALVERRQPCGVLWVLDRWPSTSEQQRLWPQAAPAWPALCWGMRAGEIPAAVSWLGDQRHTLIDSLSHWQAPGER